MFAAAVFRKSYYYLGAGAPELFVRIGFKFELIQQARIRLAATTKLVNSLNFFSMNMDDVVIKVFHL